MPQKVGIFTHLNGTFLIISSYKYATFCYMVAFMERLFNTVEIEVNTQCNLSCSYCPNSIDKRIETGEIQSSLLLKILRELKDLDFRGKISPSFYNEPLLNEKLEVIVKLIKTYLPKSSFILYTNALLLSKQRFKDLTHSGVDEFIITKHENIKKVPIESFMDSLSPDEKIKVKIQSYEEINLTNRGGKISKLNTKIKPLSPCQIPLFHVTITKDGNVLPCFEDYSQSLVMGNVYQESLLNIWNSPEYRSFRKDLKFGLRHKYDICNKCSRTEALIPPLKQENHTCTL